MFFFIELHVLSLEEKLKIRKGQSESVYRRRTDNIVAKRTSNDLQNIHTKNNDRVTGTPLKTGG